MIADRKRTLVDRILGARNSDGGWGYRADAASCAEPTALACLALAPEVALGREWVSGLTVLRHLQREDGSVGVNPDARTPGWATGLVTLAWSTVGPDSPDSYSECIDRSVHWLTHTAGKRMARNPKIFGHDTMLQGWSWVKGTHSWVEPTAYALLALQQVDKAEHPRVKEGIELLLDRTLPKGGWNYGNTRVHDAILRPFPATTGIVLCALSNHTSDARVARSIAYLTDALSSIRSPMSLGWGLIGLTACNARPKAADTWLAACARRCEGRPLRPVEDALLLLAEQTSNMLTQRLEPALHG